MDGLHLPEIVKLREQSGRCLGSASRNITAGERMTLASRRDKSSKEKRQSLGVEKLTKKKRTSTTDRQRKASSMKNSSSTSGKSSRYEAIKSQNTRRRYETIGLPKITTSTESGENASKGNDDFGAKKPRRTKGDTISYVYSKSLRDENTMAFLRNSVDFEKDLNLHYKIRDKRSSKFDKKPYGLPALKVSEASNEREQLLNTEQYSDGSFTETESLLNAWEAIDDGISNGTTYDSGDCSSGHED